MVSNKAGVYGLTRAEQHGIPTAVVDHKQFPDREAFERAVDTHLTAADIELVCLAGFMR